MYNIWINICDVVIKFSFLYSPFGIRSKPLTTFDLVYPSVLEHNEQIRNLRFFASSSVIALQLKAKVNNAKVCCLSFKRKVRVWRGFI